MQVELFAGIGTSDDHSQSYFLKRFNSVLVLFGIDVLLKTASSLL